MCTAPGKGDNGSWVSVSAGEVAAMHQERRSRRPATASSCGGTGMWWNRAIWTARGGPVPG